MAIVMVGHVTKDGNVAGPKTLEHVVDAVVALEGERTGSVRLLRATKNRFGSCDETGVFVMGQKGLEAVADPSSMLLADRCIGVPGSVIFPAIEGTRPLLMEMQALVTDSELAQPRRVSLGLDGRRLALLLGVLAERANVGFGKRDVFVAAAGGLTVKEPAADLPIALAAISAVTGKPLPSGCIAFGEIGLAGEVRRVPGGERRLQEAARLGFDRAVVPRGVGKKFPGLEVVEVASVSEAHATLTRS